MNVGPTISVIVSMPFGIKQYNGCSEPCDALLGPCLCGAWHSWGDWPVDLQNYIMQQDPLFWKNHGDIDPTLWDKHEDLILDPPQSSLSLERIKRPPGYFFSFLRGWLRRLFGWDCCGSWSEWKTYKAKCSRIPDNYEELTLAGCENIIFTRRWQERYCTKCGKIQQRDLIY